MCGRFVAASDPDGLVRFLVVDERRDEDHPPSYNVAPTDPVRAVVEHDARRYLVTFRWGLVPRWAEDRRIASKLINARCETVAEKPAFREAARRRRCLIPADGFYEWQRGRDGERTPYFIHPTDAPVFAFAGLWDAWRDRGDPGVAPLRTCTIVTKAADRRLAALHPRMPAALPPSAWDAWLDRGTTDLATVRDVLTAATPGDVDLHRVSSAVNTPRNNHPDLLAPV
jgi:putative SOS response-associated peptidase YedK